jgi:hypothetical protein
VSEVNAERGGNKGGSGAGRGDYAGAAHGDGGGGHRGSAGRDGGSKGLKRRLVSKHDIALMLVRTMSTEVTTIESLENIFLERELELQWDVFE